MDFSFYLKHENSIWSFFGYKLLEKKWEVDLSAAEWGAGPDCQDREDAHQEGEDGGQQEAPPSPLPETSSWHILSLNMTSQERDQLPK